MTSQDNLDRLLYVASFNAKESAPLRCFRMNGQTAELIEIGRFQGGVENPLYIQADVNRRCLYVADFVNECDGEPGGAVCALAINRATGELTHLNRQCAQGTVPCYVSIDRNMQHVLVANYGDGSVSVLPVLEEGKLGPVVTNSKQTGGDKTNAHCFIYSPDEKYALAANLGLDRIFVYHYDPQAGRICPDDPSSLKTADGAGPRHLAFHPNGKLLYAMTEYDNTVIAMSWNAADGKLELIDTYDALSPGFSDKSYGSDIHIHPSGKFLYGANRGDDTIVIFAVDEQTGRLTLVGHEPTQGNFPRSFLIGPAGRFLLVANEQSDSILTFAIDQETGKLNHTGQVVPVASPAGMCLVTPL